MSRGANVSLDQLARDVLDRLLEGCQVIDFEFRYIYLNDSVLRQARRRREELLGRRMVDCFPGIEETPVHAMLSHCLQQREHCTMENEFTFPDGRQGWFDLRFVPVPEGACILSIDVTEARRTAERLQRLEEHACHLQKMQAVGRMAGGIAHDFNNIFAIIMGYGELLGRTPSAASLASGFAQIQRAAERGAELTRQLVLFSDHRGVDAESLDLKRLLASFGHVARTILREDIATSLTLAPDLGFTHGNARELEQVLMNLALNARDAMPAGGELSIRAENVELYGVRATEELGLAPGSYVSIALRDTGAGICREDLRHIFEPFFTSKERPLNAGLGLTIAFGIVRRYHGTIVARSALGQGSTFDIYLPRTEPARHVPPPVEKQLPSNRLCGSERILLVEDEAQLRSVCAAMLAHAGYQVTEAEDGAQALELLRETPSSFALVLTDVVMPNLGGRELAAEIRRCWPSTKVLFMSGYHDDTAEEARDVPLMAKPFSAQTLLQTLRTLLDAR